MLKNLKIQKYLNKKVKSKLNFRKKYKFQKKKIKMLENNNNKKRKIKFLRLNKLKIYVFRKFKPSLKIKNLMQKRS